MRGQSPEAGCALAMVTNAYVQTKTGTSNPAEVQVDAVVSLEEVSADALGSLVLVRPYEPAYEVLIELFKVQDTAPGRHRDPGVHVRVRRYDELCRVTRDQFGKLLDKIITTLGTVVVKTYATVFKVVNEGFIRYRVIIETPTYRRSVRCSRHRFRQPVRS